jgi:pimeloyl-ACP methyl ester carboxylesterase
MSVRSPRLAACVVVAGLAPIGALLFPPAPDVSATGIHFVTDRISKAVVRVWRITYRTHRGARRPAFVMLPAWYGPRDDPRIPLVISPHGRGASARASLESWGALPAIGRFAVISPAGQGRRLRNDSWGAPGQVDDLARMAAIAQRTLPWLRIEQRAVFAVGGSMGGQETLLLLARFPHLLAGAAAFDSVTNFARQYRDFPQLRCDRKCRRHWNGPIGRVLQRMARREVGGTPASDPGGYAERSPLRLARRIAFSGVPLELWWSTADLIAPHQQQEQSGALFARIRSLNPDAPVEAFVGHWIHAREDRANSRLPYALAQLGLLPARFDHRSTDLHYVAPIVWLVRSSESSR